EVRHLSGVPMLEPVEKVMNSGRRDRRGHADQLETESLGFGFQRRGEHRSPFVRRWADGGHGLLCARHQLRNSSMKVSPSENFRWTINFATCVTGNPGSARLEATSEYSSSAPKANTVSLSSCHRQTSGTPNAA